MSSDTTNIVEHASNIFHYIREVNKSSVASKRISIMATIFENIFGYKVRA